MFCMGRQNAERLPKKISRIVEDITKKPLPSWKKQLLLEVVCDDGGDDDEVDVPFIVVNVDERP